MSFASVISIAAAAGAGLIVTSDASWNLFGAFID
jgi:hypothetical protein